METHLHDLPLSSEMLELFDCFHRIESMAEKNGLNVDELMMEKTGMMFTSFKNQLTEVAEQRIAAFRNFDQKNLELKVFVNSGNQ